MTAAGGGGGYWRLEMRLGLVLGYGNAFGVESGPECWGRGGYPPPPLKRFPAPTPPPSSLSQLPHLYTGCHVGGCIFFFETICRWCRPFPVSVIAVALGLSILDP